MKSSVSTLYSVVVKIQFSYILIIHSRILVFYNSLALLGSFRSNLDMESICDNRCNRRRCRLVSPSTLPFGRRFVCTLQGNADLTIAASNSIDVRTISMRSIGNASASLGVGIHPDDIRLGGQCGRVRVVS